MRRLLLAAVAASAITAVPAAHAAGPFEAGSRAVVSFDYDGGTTVLGPTKAPTVAQPMVARLHGRVFLPAGHDRVPLLMFVHGRHGTCDLAGIETIGGCANTPVSKDVASYTGYDYLARDLATHGYAVASIDANSVNDQDIVEQGAGALQRSQLISRNLDLLQSWDGGGGPAQLVGRMDLSRLGLMGHSRGGEAVAAWVAYDRTRTDGPHHPARAVFALAPIDATLPVVTGVPFATLLPRCDGDVYDLEGAPIYDRSRYASSAPLAQYVVQGANHNFFNSVWTRDDQGAGDSRCDSKARGSLRLTPSAERRVGSVVIAAFLRRYVGGERVFDPWLTGARTWEPACDRSTKVSCRELIRTSFLAAPTERQDLLRAGTPVGAMTSRAVVAATCWPEKADPCEGDQAAAGQGTTERSLGQQLSVAWSTPGSLTLTPGRPLDARRRVLVLRASVPRDARNEGADDVPGEFTVPMTVVFHDAGGHQCAVPLSSTGLALAPSPGTRVVNTVLSGYRVRLCAGVDQSRVAAVELRFPSSLGVVHLADVALAP